MPVPETGPEDGRWIPKVFRDLTQEERRGIIRSYYNSVEYLDKNVGLVLDALKNLGLDRNTLVLYVSDHGYLLGHHGRFEKHSMWEEAVRVPLIVRDPRYASRRVDALVELVDLAPTILDALEVPPLPGQQGKSLGDLLRGGEDRHRETVFSEYLDDHRAMVRDLRWKYVITSGKHDLALGYATGFGSFRPFRGLVRPPGRSPGIPATWQAMRSTPGGSPRCVRACWRPSGTPTRTLERSLPIFRSWNGSRGFWSLPRI